MHAIDVNSYGNEPPTKKYKRQERSQNLILSKRIWVLNQAEATRFYPMGLLFGYFSFGLVYFASLGDWLSLVPSISPRVVVRDGDLIPDCT